MKNGMLICSGDGRFKNIGDYVQSLVAEVFFDSIDVLVEREKLNEFTSKEKTLLIMNAWYMWHPENWPPSNDIIPLLTSIHINQKAKNIILSGEGYKYFKQHEPIGCRDMFTYNTLKEKNIKSYFSGCLTLCLGLKYKCTSQRNRIYFVDPYYECISGVSTKFSIKNIIQPLKYGIVNFSKVKPLLKKIKYETKLSFLEPYLNFFEKFLNAAAFYKTYSTMFSDDIIYNATYITHAVSQELFATEYEKLEFTRKLLIEYSTAKLIITSRIHCALPALGMETPTLFVVSDYLNVSKKLSRNGGRFEGLLELLHIIKYDNYKLYENIEIPKLINQDTIIKNKSSYKKIQQELVSICSDFLNNYSKK